MKLHLRLAVLLLLLPIHLIAQNVSKTDTPDATKVFMSKRMAILCSEDMQGRGYVGNGRLMAANYLSFQFKALGLKPLQHDSGYFQTYTFNVNAFPGNVNLSLNGKKRIPGVDFLVDAASAPINIENGRVKVVDLQYIKDSAQWAKEKATWDSHKVYLLKNIDSVARHLCMKMSYLSKCLPAGCYLVAKNGKLTWTVATTAGNNTVMTVEDSVLPKKTRKVSMQVETAYEKAIKNENVMAMVPGTLKDSFIVFTSHYDHLGMMGKEAMFPGANDNASGTSMMLYLASYYAQHPGRYTMVFIGFSGEEAGLIGSKYFTEHPLIPLNRIRFLTNLDMVGDATNGITVVNATTFKNEFELLKQVNEKNHYLKEIKSRDKAANSDHYHFTEAGVPSFFIYSNGGKGYYHDVFDTPSNLSLNNVGKLSDLLIHFVSEIR